MSTVYNPEADIIAQIEKLELHARDTRRKLAQTTGEEDRRVLEKLLKETEQQIAALRARLP